MYAASGRSPRLACRTRMEDPERCSNRLTVQSVFEAQLGAYLASFHIPEDSQLLIAAMRSAVDDAEQHAEERRRLEARLERSKRLYEWGDKPEAEYLAERAEVRRRLVELTPIETDGPALEKLAAILRNIQVAWKVADQEERNDLARTLFAGVRLHGDRGVGVKPHP